MTNLPRGLRNFNPGNIDRNGTKWLGMAADQSSDPRFVVFTDPKYGIRALAKTLMTYQDKYQLDCVRKIITRWAPPSEMTPDGKQPQTEPYIRAVAKEIGVDPDKPIDVDEVAVMLPLVKAIIRHENAGCPYTDAELMAGLYLAGVHDAPAARLTQYAAVMPVAVNPSNPPPAVASFTGSALPIDGHNGFLQRLWSRLA